MTSRIENTFEDISMNYDDTSDLYLEGIAYFKFGQDVFRIRGRVLVNSRHMSNDFMYMEMMGTDGWATVETVETIGVPKLFDRMKDAGVNIPKKLSFTPDPVNYMDKVKKMYLEAVERFMDRVDTCYYYKEPPVKCL